MIKEIPKFDPYLKGVLFFEQRIAYCDNKIAKLKVRLGKLEALREAYSKRLEHKKMTR